jgi:uncharacterized protein YjiS (DUF1127 family)
MHPHMQTKRYPISEVVDWRSPDRPRTITVVATRPMHLAGLFSEIADLFPRPRISVLPALRRFPAMISEWRRRARSRRELLALDDHMLKDIGVTRFDAQYQAARRFWR